MSYWGAQVIVSLFGAIPYIGPDLMEWIRGDFLMSETTLNRFFALHVVALPLVLCVLIFVHLVALHHVGSNNPDGIEIKKNKDDNGIPKDGIPFHPYYTVHDIHAMVVFLFIFCAVVFFAPEMGGYFLEYNNFLPADSLKTPPHIAPTWYFTPFYSVLRATTSDFMWVVMAGLAAYVVFIWLRSRLSYKTKIAITVLAVLVEIGMLPQVLDAKFWGVVLFGSAVVILALLPWLDHSPVRSIRYRPGWHKAVYGVFFVCFLVLGYLGTQLPTATYTLIAQLATLLYFSFFLLMPWWSTMGRFKPLPKRVTWTAH